MEDDPNEINAMPTKAFFVEMLVKDISLDRAVLDLVDNCIDGAKRMHPEEEPTFSGLTVRLTMTGEQFEIEDNCGGFDVETARQYAFRFGRPETAEPTDYSIGQFGVGMKRALFKFGRYFEVHSATKFQKWSMKVDVDKWERQEKWVFDFDERTDAEGEPDWKVGTRIVVKQLRQEVASQFSSEHFRRQLTEMLRSHQRQFLAWRLTIDFDGTHLVNTDLRVKTGGGFNPAVEKFVFEEQTDFPVEVRIVAGVSASVPSRAGWYVICNGRVVLSADHSEQTGWNSVGEQQDGIPKFHNQYARFRGIVFFDCKSSRKLPWNTTKTGLDSTSKIWRIVLPKMLDHTRVAVVFLNKLANEIEEEGDSAPTLNALERNTREVDVEKLRDQQVFSWNQSPKRKGEIKRSIQYYREESKIEALKTALGVRSGKAVGETSFDIVYEQQEGDAE